MKSPNEVATEVEHLDNMARERNEPGPAREAIALLDELAGRQSKHGRWVTMSWALRLRMTWEPTAPSTEVFFLDFVRQVEAAEHANIVERKIAVRSIRSSLRGPQTEAMKRWRDANDVTITGDDLESAYPGTIPAHAETLNAESMDAESVDAEVIPIESAKKPKFRIANDALSDLLKAAHAKNAKAYRAAAQELAAMAERNAVLPTAFTVAQRFTEDVEDTWHPVKT